MIAGIQPGKSASQCFHLQSSTIQILVVNAGNLDFSSCGGFYILCNLNDIVVIEIQSGNRIIAPGMLRLFFDGKCPAVLVEFHHTVFSGVTHIISENSSTLFSCGSSTKHLRETLTVENIITQNQRNTIITDKIRANDKCVSQTSRLILYSILQMHAQLTSIAKQLLENRKISRS